MARNASAPASTEPDCRSRAIAAFCLLDLLVVGSTEVFDVRTFLGACTTGLGFAAVFAAFWALAYCCAIQRTLMATGSTRVSIACWLAPNSCTAKVRRSL